MLNKKKKTVSVGMLLALVTALTGFTSYASLVQADNRMADGRRVEWKEIAATRSAADIAESGVGKAKELQEEKERQEELEARRAAEEAARAAEEARIQAEAEQERLRQYDQKLLASIIFCEAGNQPYEGQVAVGAVVMNRIRSSVYPDTMEAVIYQAGQFGPAVTGWLDQIRAADGYTESAMQAAADAIAGVNPVGDCLYFDQGGCGMQIGDHYFH